MKIRIPYSPELFALVGDKNLYMEWPERGLLNEPVEYIITHTCENKRASIKLLNSRTHDLSLWYDIGNGIAVGIPNAKLFYQTDPGDVA